VSLKDLEEAARHNKIPLTQADIHAVMSELDQQDDGCVDIGQFTRKFTTHQANFIDYLNRPIRQVYFEGGPVLAGPQKNRQLDALGNEMPAQGPDDVDIETLSPNKAARVRADHGLGVG
jgi:hypothetical protein